VNFGASRAIITAVGITGLGDNVDGQSINFVELRSRCHRPKAHPGSQVTDSRGQPNTLDPFPGGFTRKFQQAKFGGCSECQAPRWSNLRSLNQLIPSFVYLGFL